MNREEIAQLINENIYDNSYKEITAAMVREVFEQYKESFFNLVDDRLKTLWYDNNSTLEEVIGNMEPPYWGSTGYFNIHPDNDGNTISSGTGYGGNGMVSSVIYHALGGSESSDASLEIHVNKDISNKKLMVQVHTSSNSESVMNESNDVMTPIIYRLNSNTLYVALREYGSHTQNIRLEIFAFSVNDGQ